VFTGSFIFPLLDDCTRCIMNHFYIPLIFPSTAWSCCSLGPRCICTGNCDLRQCHGLRWQTRRDMFSIIQDRNKADMNAKIIITLKISLINAAFFTVDRSISRCQWKQES